jgi:pyruvate kinase
MSIIYTIIVKGTETVMATFNRSSGNFPQITMKILAKIKKDERKSYNYK